MMFLLRLIILCSYQDKCAEISFHVPKHRTQVHCTEPICYMVVVWEFIFSFHRCFLGFILSEKAFPLTFLAALLLRPPGVACLVVYLALVKDGTQASET